MTKEQLVLIKNSLTTTYNDLIDRHEEGSLDLQRVVKAEYTEVGKLIKAIKQEIANCDKLSAQNSNP
jgi:hypothetical protein